MGGGHTSHFARGAPCQDTASLKLGGGGQKARKAAWDPLHSREAVAAVGTGFVGVDLRSMTCVAHACLPLAAGTRARLTHVL